MRAYGLLSRNKLWGFKMLNPDLHSGNKVKEKFQEIIVINNSIVTLKRLLTKNFLLPY